MEYPYGWMPDLAWEGWDEERRIIESELEMQIWRWALLEADLREASLVYESLMGSPLAPTAQGERVHPARARARQLMRETTLFHPVGAVAVPKGGASVGDFSSTRSAAHGSLDLDGTWSRPRSERAGEGV